MDRSLSERSESRHARTIGRLDAPTRAAGIDLARGLAVIGMFAAHLLWIEPFSWADPATWTDIVNGRSSILFATLAGVSIALFTGGSTPVSGPALRDARIRLGVRALLLWLLGLCLIATQVPVFVILPAYAVLFLLALPFLPLHARRLLPLAGALAIVMPLVQPLLDAPALWQSPVGNDLSLLLGWHYPFTVWVAFLLCGIGVGRLDLRSVRVQVALLVAGAALALVGYGLHAFSSAEPVPGVPVTWWMSVWTAEPHSSGMLEVIGSGGFALAVIGLCLLLCGTWLRWIALPLRAVGAMPLTAYTAQILTWWLLQPDPGPGESTLGAFRALEPFWPLTLAMIAGCTLWALLIGRGPLEWAVDRLSRIAVRGFTEPPAA